MKHMCPAAVLACMTPVATTISMMHVNTACCRASKSHHVCIQGCRLDVHTSLVLFASHTRQKCRHSACALPQSGKPYLNLQASSMTMDRSPSRSWTWTMSWQTRICHGAGQHKLTDKSTMLARESAVILQMDGATLGTSVTSNMLLLLQHTTDRLHSTTLLLLAPVGGLAMEQLVGDLETHCLRFLSLVLDQADSTQGHVYQLCSRRW